MADVVGLKLIYNDGTLEDVKRYITIIEDADKNVSVQMANIDPMKQVAYISMVLDTMMNDYMDASSDPNGIGKLSNWLRELSTYLMHEQQKQQTKGILL